MRTKSADPAGEDEGLAEQGEVIIGFYVGDFELLAEFGNLVVGGEESCGAEEAAAGGEGGRWIGAERGRFGCGV